MVRIDERPDGSFLIRISIGSEKERKRVKRIFHPEGRENARRLAEAYAAELEKELKEGMLPLDRLPYETFAREHWLPEWAVYNLSPGVRQGYVVILEQRAFPVIGEIEISKIRPVAIKGILVDMLDSGKSVGTVRRTRSVISSVFRYAEDLEAVQKNPCVGIRLPRQQKRKRAEKIHYWTPEEARLFLRALELQYPVKIRKRTRTDSHGAPYPVREGTYYIDIDLQTRALFTLLLYTGMRRGEAVALRWCDIDFYTGQIHIRRAAEVVQGGTITKSPKTEAGLRTVPLPPRCAELLERWAQTHKWKWKQAGKKWQGESVRVWEENCVFIQKSGRMMDPGTIGKKFSNIIDRFNETYALEPSQEIPKIRLHDLRHTVATLLIADGTDIETVSRILGHEKVSTTLDIYGHWMEERQEAAADRLSDILGGKR